MKKLFKILFILWFFGGLVGITFGVWVDAMSINHLLPKIIFTWTFGMMGFAAMIGYNPKLID